MRKSLILIALLGVIFMASGCSGISQNIVKFDDQNAKQTVANAKQVMKHWQMNSAAIHESLDDFKSKMPSGFWTSMDKLDKYATDKYGSDQSKMTEADAGDIVVLIAKLVEPIITSLINQYAPNLWANILKYLPAFITL